MKTSNKLLFGLLGCVVLALVIANFALKKEIKNNTNKKNKPETTNLMEKSPLKTDTITLDSAKAIK